ncbi:hypothetical protein PsYK624_081060 [Phanerochaete sordida]|uniref:Uncharacterized protein n=1 Tax=Phanerochaete sordida TaxID=48140 RepID=A0A9P3GDU3_9APHY|nr:hypothetical protein PsYK624_081060 [Phanerochaete sordida]
MNAFIIGSGARLPAHVPVYTADAWAAKLKSGLHALKKLEVHISSLSVTELAVLSNTSWKNMIALDELVFTMTSGSSRHARYADAAGQRCANIIIASLPSSLLITRISIRNSRHHHMPTDTSCPACQGTVTAVDELKALVSELDALLSERMAVGTLQHISFASSRPYMQPITETEKSRVREFFPLLTSVDNAL